jgi:hypothetical protein
MSDNQTMYKNTAAEQLAHSQAYVQYQMNDYLNVNGTFVLTEQSRDAYIVPWGALLNPNQPLTPGSLTWLNKPQTPAKPEIDYFSITRDLS